MLRRSLLASGAALPLIGTARAQQTYPTKPIRLVVGYTPGGGNDLIARIVAAKLQDKLGQPVMVDNKPGAQSIVAAELVAKAPPDGYTLLVAPSGPMTINPAVYSKLPYDAAARLRAGLAAGRVPAAAGGRRRPAGEDRSRSWSSSARPTPSSPTTPRAPRRSSSPRSCSTSAPARRSSTSPIKGSGEMVQAVRAGQVLMTIADSGAGGRAAQGGQAARDRHHHGQAAPGVPGRADLGRAGHLRHGDLAVDRHRGAQRHAGRDRRAAAGRDRGHDRDAGACATRSRRSPSTARSTTARNSAT